MPTDTFNEYNCYENLEYCKETLAQPVTPSEYLNFLVPATVLIVVVAFFETALLILFVEMLKEGAKSAAEHQEQKTGL